MRRARLVINRDGLAPARIIWPLEPAIAQNPRYSVYDLLRDVNEAFPLDEGARGLEDYTVEIAGCDLVHYMPIAHLVGDQDELTIRPLTPTEIRERRKGGRRQISKVGRVLLDGVAPGRLFVTPAPDRPRITGGDRPAKRRKISNAITEEDSSDLDIHSWAPVVTSRRRKTLRSASRTKGVRFEDKDGEVDNSSAMVLATEPYADEDDEDDDDFDPNAVEGGDDESEEEEEEEEEGGEIEDNKDGSGGEEEEGEGEDAVEDQSAESESGEEEDEEESAATADLDQVLKRLSGTGSQATGEADSSEEEEEDDEEEDEDYESESESSNSSSDEDEESEDLSDEGEGGEINPAKVSKKGDLKNSAKVEELSDNSSQSSSSDSDDSSDESLQSSDAESSSDSSSDSSSENDDNSDEGAKKRADSDKLNETKGPIEAEKPEELSSKIIPTPPKPPRSLPPMVTTTKPPLSLPEVATATKTPLQAAVTTAKAPLSLPLVTTAAPPFQGASSTRSRNQRRKEAKRLAHYIKEGILPAGSTKDDLRKYQEQQKMGNGEVSDTNTGVSNGVGAAPRGHEAADVSDENAHVQDGSPKYIPMEPLEVVVEEVNISIEVPVTSQQQAEPSKPSQSEELSFSPVGTNRRRPVVSDAAKRLMLGGLGLRLPRNQAEDEKQREDWKKKNSKLVGNKSKGFLEAMAGKEGIHSKFDASGEVVTEVKSTQPAQDPDAWKQKIQLSAVECDEDYYNGMDDKLPVPSFPFDQQQLWQPQANSSKKSKKKKKNKRKREDEESFKEGTWNADIYDDSPMQVDSAQRPGQIERSTQGADEDIDDLPPVPDNLTDYPMIKLPVLLESILVFKKLVPDSNYNAIYRQVTAKVLSTKGSNVLYQLAKRDRPKAIYDEETGERIFGRFHMPGMEDDYDTVNGIEDLTVDNMLEGRVIRAGLPVQDHEALTTVEEEDEIDRVPETILEGVKQDKGNVKVQSLPQIENEDTPMPEAESVPVLAVPNDSIQSSSFVEPPFQTNGSDGDLDTDDDMDDAREEKMPAPEGHHEDDVTNDHASQSRARAPVANIQEEHVNSSSEAHRYDDAPSQGLISQDNLGQNMAKAPAHAALETEAEESIAEPEESVVQVPETPNSEVPGSPVQDTSMQYWDLSVDISALEPGDAEIVEKMVKVKEECPDDPDMLREALKPFHHPSEVQDEVNISVDISPPVSPIIKKERLSTQDALSSPVAPLKDITGRSTSGDNVEYGEEPQDEGVDGRDNNNTNFETGSGYLGNEMSPPLANDSSSPLKSDSGFKRRPKAGALYRRKGPSLERKEIKEVIIKQEDTTADNDFAIPSTMPERSLTSGRTAFSGRSSSVNSASSREAFRKEPEYITIPSDDEDESLPRASLGIIKGAVTTKRGKVSLKPAWIKKRNTSGDSQSFSSQRSASSQI